MSWKIKVGQEFSDVGKRAILKSSDDAEIQFSFLDLSELA